MAAAPVKRYVARVLEYNSDTPTSTWEHEYVQNILTCIVLLFLANQFIKIATRIIERILLENFPQAAITWVFAKDRGKPHRLGQVQDCVVAGIFVIAGIYRWGAPEEWRKNYGICVVRVFLAVVSIESVLIALLEIFVCFLWVGYKAIVWAGWLPPRFRGTDMKDDPYAHYRSENPNHAAQPPATKGGLFISNWLLNLKGLVRECLMRKPAERKEFFHSITARRGLRHQSFEELRLESYEEAKAFNKMEPPFRVWVRPASSNRLNECPGIRCSQLGDVLRARGFKDCTDSAGSFDPQTPERGSDGRPVIPDLLTGTPR